MVAAIIPYSRAEERLWCAIQGAFGASALLVLTTSMLSPAATSLPP